MGWTLDRAWEILKMAYKEGFFGVGSTDVLLSYNRKHSMKRRQVAERLINELFSGELQVRIPHDAYIMFKSTGGGEGLNFYDLAAHAWL